MIYLGLLLTVALLGHFGWWLFCYNRINAVAIPRYAIKAIERLFVFLSFAIPILCWVLDGHRIVGTRIADEPFTVLLSGLAPIFSCWFFSSLFFAVALGPGWLESRLWLRPPRNLRTESTRRFEMEDEIGEPVTSLPFYDWCARIPGNEISHLTLTEKELVLEANRSRQWRSIRIGHISDLHFTGGMKPQYYHKLVDKLQALQPDLVVLAGDIIDKDHCVDWLEAILGRIDAPMGKYFVIGNHELKLSDARRVIDRLVETGWGDLGVSDAIAKSTAPHLPTVRLLGNELPWYRRHAGQYWDVPNLEQETTQQELLLGVAHSPDQISWARRLGLDLLLAGHTHGGQVRIPGIGPLVAPSWSGSRFASGVFCLPPTLVHVSRGVSGCHPYRWRCPPEVTVLDVHAQ